MTMMNKAMIGLIVFLALPIRAEDLGTKNKTVPIGRDGREQMKDQIRAKEKNGELKKFWENYREKTISSIKNPAPLGIATDTKFRAEVRELKFYLPQDYKDNNGVVIAKRGTVIEPLKIQPLVTGLIFIDGRDIRQVEYAIKAGRTERLKIVLTAGSPYDLRVKYKDYDWNGTKTIPFYFDQRKMIINQLSQLYKINISSVPAKLTQEKDKLKIEFGVKK